MLRGDARGEVRGAMDERDFWRVKTGSHAVFIPDDLLLPSVAVVINDISSSAMPTLDQLELAGSHGVGSQIDWTYGGRPSQSPHSMACGARRQTRWQRHS